LALDRCASCSDLVVESLQPMVDSWTAAFARDFHDEPATQLVEVRYNRQVDHATFCSMSFLLDLVGVCLTAESSKGWESVSANLTGVDMTNWQVQRI
jgi:hypothetical protein